MIDHAGVEKTNAEMPKTSNNDATKDPLQAKLPNEDNDDAMTIDDGEINNDVTNTTDQFKSLTLVQTDPSVPSTSESPADPEQPISRFGKRHRGNRAGRRVQEQRRITFLAHMVLAMGNKQFRSPVRRNRRGGHRDDNGQQTS
ncbi:uncharacterized protein [Venturia canescens]|uniref:uncharacterized protein n=1 Tax=Venturia canescens TaxID=32260 RepID=UPI001C9C260C|nr:uncharacterized protein LOC122418318 [Venturia canescens]